jgi:hypothetical protein
MNFGLGPQDEEKPAMRNTTIRATVAVLAAVLSSAAAPPQPSPPDLVPYERTVTDGWKETKLWGYSDPSGRLVIPARFEVAKRFAPDGLAEVKRDGRWGMIDRQGQEIIPVRFTSVTPFSDGLTAVGVDTGEVVPGLWQLGPRPGQRTAITERAYGFLDRQGKVAIPLEYESVHPFQEGLAPVSVAGPSTRCPAVDMGRAILYGLIDTKGRLVLPTEHCGIGPLQDGLIRVEYEWPNLSDKRVGFVDREGRVVIPKLPYDFAAERWSEGLLLVRHQGQWGFIDRKGREVIPPRYEDAWSASEGRIRAKLGGRWGFLDLTGKVAIPFQHEYAGDFDQGLACVFVDNRAGFIDRDGKMAIAPQYDAHPPSCHWRFSEGLRPMSRDGKWGYIDPSGTWVIKPQLDEAWGFSEGLAAARKDDLWGFVDRSGRWVIPARYFRVDEGFFEGLAYVTVRVLDPCCKEIYKFSEGFIDRKGREFFDAP